MPSLVVDVLRHAELGPGMRVLEVGAGTGWNDALLCELVGEDGVLTAVGPMTC